METKERFQKETKNFGRKSRKFFLERTKINIFEGNEKTNFRRKPKYKFWKKIKNFGQKAK